MGSRYGSLKQMDSFGPSGETIIEYSIYDAIRAGFEKVVFVVRESFHKEIEEHFRKRIGDRIELAFVDQELHLIPEEFELNPERTKPWGTAHAVMMGRSEIKGCFAVINADDFYGPSAYKTLVEFFREEKSEDIFSVVSYYLENTLSDHGTVNRGVCYKNDEGYLDKIIETLKISRDSQGNISYPNEEGGVSALGPRTLVSMNMFGFTPLFFDYAEKSFRSFMEEQGDALKSEFFIPYVLDQMINREIAKVKVLTSDDKWFGVTYKEDKPIVINKLYALIEQGMYPRSLWA